MKVKKPDAMHAISIKLTRKQLDILQAQADKIGHGATVTGVMRQLVIDLTKQLDGEK